MVHLSHLLFFTSLAFFIPSYGIEVTSENITAPDSFKLLQKEFKGSGRFIKVKNTFANNRKFVCYESINTLNNTSTIYCIKKKYNQYITLFKIFLVRHNTLIAKIHIGAYPDPVFTTLSNKWEVEYLYTAPSCREQSYATKLLQEGEFYLKRAAVKELFLIADDSLTDWYFKRGFYIQDSSANNHIYYLNT